MSAQSRTAAVPNDLASYWMPFTPNRAFKKAPRLIARAKDMHYYTPDGRAVLDGTAGLWCTNAGHNREPVVAAIRTQAAELDYAPAFQFSHPKAFELASRVAALAPDQAGARAFAAHVVVGERDLERGVDRLRSGVAEEHVIEIRGRERGDAARKLERLGMRELKGRRIVELGRLGADRLHDRIAIVPGIGAPHPGGAVEQGAAVGGVVVHVLGARDQPRGGLERAVGRERDPIGFEIVGDGAGQARWCRWHGDAPLILR